jgi:hypothetical protein
MTAYCLKPFKGKIMRVVTLDACGAVVTGAKKMVVSDGFVSVEQRAVYRDPTDYEIVNANGDYCLSERDESKLRWIELTITLCGVDPEMVNIMTGSPLVMNDAATPEAVGFRTRENVFGNFGLEIWTDLGGSTGCAGGVKAYGYQLLPWIQGGVLGDYTVENGAANFQIINAHTHNNSLWSTGPFNVRNTVITPTPAKLITAISATDHRHMQLTTLAPPAPVCGAQTLTPDA